ncbi:MAG: hypothetical protein AAFR76_12255 [Planctomycetota bacterium]
MKRDGFIGRLGRQMGRRVGDGARSLLSSAGKAEGSASFEALEPRVLLTTTVDLPGIDNPGIDDVFPDSGTGVIPNEISDNLDEDSTVDPVSGSFFDVGFQAGFLSSTDTDDVYSFTARSNGFLSILADTVGGTLDTQVEVYLPDGTEITGDNEGFSNGNLGRGFASDGWFGFVTSANQEYYIRVVAQNASSLTGDEAYALRFNGVIESLALDADGIARTGSDRDTDNLSVPPADAQVIQTLQEDKLYRFTTGSDASLGYVLAADIVFGDGPLGYIDSFTDDGDGAIDPANPEPDAERDLFDARVEVFDADGNLVSADSDSGFIYDAYALVRFEENSTYYVRVRSDAPESVSIIHPQTLNQEDVSVGTFELRVQTLATELTFDPATLADQSRTIEVDRSSSGRDIDTNVVPTEVPTDPADIETDPAGLLRDQHSAQIFSFETLSAGVNFVNFFLFGDDQFGTAAFPGLPNPSGDIDPVLDPTLSVFDDSGSLTPFQSNDTLVQGDAFDRPGIRFTAGGDERYFVMVDFFDGEFSGTGAAPGDATIGQVDYRLVIESAAVLDESDEDQRVDDHIDFTGIDQDGDGTLDVVDQRVADAATPLVWGRDASGDPFTPRGFTNDDFFVPDAVLQLPPNEIPDAYLFPGLLDPRLINDPANSVFDVTDHSRVVRAFGDGRLDSGDDTDVFQFVPEVDMLGSHAGSIDLLSGADPEAPGEAPMQQWFPDGRPASRLTVNVFFETEWVNLGTTRVQIFDSNFDLINEELIDPNESVISGGPNSPTQVPSGVETPSLLPPQPSEVANVDQTKAEISVTLDNQYWGGEVYYLVVSSDGGESRYNVFLQADAFDEDSSQYAFDVETAEEGNFGAAQELVFSNFSGVASNNGNLNFTGDIREVPVLISDVFDTEMMIEDPISGDQVPNPNFGQPDPLGAGYYDAAQYFGQLGIINAVDDSDIYRFTAQNDGTTEILLSTTNLQDSFTEVFRANALGGLVVDTNTLNKTYNSPLDAAIRVFDSTGAQIAYVDDFLGYAAAGEFLTFPPGQGNVGTVRVERKDPRFVIDVERGEQYFVVVESSQRWSANADAEDPADRTAAESSNGEIDWRIATGSYQLIVNTTPNQAGTPDDHVNSDFGRQFRATVIPFDSDPASPNNGTGSISGVIEVQNDVDAFEFLAPTSGIATLTLDPSGTLSMGLAIFDGNTVQIPIQPSSAIAGERLTLQFAVSQGERYLISASGLNGTGAYDIEISGLAVEDDFAGEGRYGQAVDLSFGSFDRSIQTTASIEQAGDTEIFTFVAPEADFLTVRVSENNSPGFAGSVEVYEQTKDPSNLLDPLTGQVIQNHFLVAYDVNPDFDATVETVVSTQQGRTYFVVVRGASTTATTGDYLLELTNEASASSPISA